MKRILSLATLALLCVPSLAMADVGSASAPSSGIAQVRTQMMQLHKQERAQMLSALTPAHRTMLSNLAGQLATSPNPDRDAAARTLDGALTRNEVQSILRVHENFRNQSRQLMTTARNQYMSTLTPEQRQAMAARMASHQSQMNGTRPSETDAGRLLLGMSSNHGGMGMHFMH